MPAALASTSPALVWSSRGQTAVYSWGRGKGRSKGRERGAGPDPGPQCPSPSRAGQWVPLRRPVSAQGVAMRPRDLTGRSARPQAAPRRVMCPKRPQACTPFSSRCPRSRPGVLGDTGWWSRSGPGTWGTWLAPPHLPAPHSRFVLWRGCPRPGSVSRVLSSILPTNRVSLRGSVPCWPRTRPLCVGCSSWS